MTPLLALLPLLAPAQEPQAADFLPADTLIAVEISAEPFLRQQEEMIITQLFHQEKLAQIVTPMASQAHQMMEQVSMQVGFDLGTLLHGSRFHLAVPVELTHSEGDSPLVIAIDLPTEIAQAINLADMLNGFAQGAWWQGGSVLVGSIYASDMDSAGDRIDRGMQTQVFEPNPHRAVDEQMLAKLLLGARTGNGWTSTPAYRRMSAEISTGNELLAVWVNLALIDEARLERWTGEETPEGFSQLMESFGFNTLEGFGYTFSASAPMFEDRYVIAGPNFGREVLPADLLELVNLKGMLEVLPHDAMHVQLMALDFEVMSAKLQKLLQAALAMEGEQLPAEAEPFLDALWSGLEAMGPVTSAMVRQADYDQGLPGELWAQVRKPEQLQAALDLIPAEVFQGLESAAAVSPAIPKIKMAIEGSRFMLMESIGQPTTERLMTQAEFMPSAQWLQQFPANELWLIEFVNREAFVEGFEVLRDRGQDVLGTFDGELEINLDLLPERVVLQSILRPMTTASLANENGLTTITRSPLGSIPSRLLMAVPTMMTLFESLGVMAESDAFYEEEF